MNPKQNARIAGGITAFGIVGILTIGGAIPASAATGTNGTDPAKNDKGQCLATPSRVDLVNHDKVSHFDKVVTPGEDAVVELQQRWSREIPEVAEESVKETYFYREIAAIAASWQYFDTIPEQLEVSHQERQFSRTNPGQTQTFTDYYKYKQVIPAQSGTKEYSWKISVDDYKIKYQYQKQVKGVVQVKNPYGKWENTGQSFDWEWYSSPSYQWSFDDKTVLESGGHNSVQSEWTSNGQQYRKVTQAYQYTKNGVTQQVKTGSHWEYQWGVNSPGNGWVKTGEERWLAGQEPKPEQTIFYQDGAWVTGNPGAPWIQYDQKSEGNGDAIAPFTEYRAADGSPTTDANNAGWFKEESFEGWSQYGQPKTVIDQEYVAARTVYLYRDAQGNLQQTEDEAQAGRFTAADTTEIDGTVWTKFNEQAGSSARTLYLTQIAEGVFGETEDPEEASWLLVDDPNVDRTLWSQALGEDGEPYYRITVIHEYEPGYTEYYVPGGEPTRELGDSNWTPENEAPEAWTFVDEREHVVKEAIPEKVTLVEVVDKEAWTERKQVPATYEVCALAMTGGDGSPLDWGSPSNIGLLAAGGLMAAGVLLTRRQRRQLEQV